jgi:shikimate dehydrogenase
MGYRFAVLGDPVEHSRSPRLHGAMLEISGLEGVYERVRADESILAAAMEGLRTGEWDGLNITMPLKREAARLADSLSSTAARAFSVNTLKLSEGEISGHSTDSSAFSELFDSPRFANRSSVLVLGNGGSAAAALTALGKEPNVYVAGRNEEAAHALTMRLGGKPVRWGSTVAGALLINATPIGMSGGELPEDLLGTASGLIDLPYGDQETFAVSRARSLGLPLADGHEFLLRQAIASFALWTGVTVSLETLTDHLRNT